MNPPHDDGQGWTQVAPSSWRALFWERGRLGWAFYDWANSAFVLCVITVIGPAYFVGTFQNAAGGQGRLPFAGLMMDAEAAWSLMIGLSALVVALSSPLLGYLSDQGGMRKRFLAAYCLLGVLATLTLWWPLPWWGVALFILLGNIGFEGGNVFYNAYLTTLAAPADQARLSSLGFAMGYLGGLLALVMCLVWFILPPESDAALVRNSFILVGLWWGGFALLSFAWLPPDRGGKPPAQRGGVPNGGAVGHLVQSLRDFWRLPNAVRFLLAFLLYIDGITTLISNVTPYALKNIFMDADQTVPISMQHLITAIILVQACAIPGTVFHGWLATRLGEKRTLYITLFWFAGVVAYGMVARLVTEFYVMAGCIGLVLGASQAISRSVFGQLVPPGWEAEYFGYYAISSKFSSVLGPWVYGALVLWTGESRQAIFSLVLFFAVGGILLSRVDMDQGRIEARQEAARRNGKAE